MTHYARPSFPQWCIALILYLAVCGCSPITVKERGDITVNMPRSYSVDQETDSTGAVFWDESFPSSRLRADLRTLYADNYEIEAARHRVEQAALAYNIAGSYLMPSLDATGGFERSRDETRTGGDSRTTENSIALGALASWEPDIWGRLRARKMAAQLLFKEKEVVAEKVALDMQSMLVQAWIGYQISHKIERILIDQQQTNRQMLELTELRLSQGNGSSLDVLQQKGRLAALERKLPGVASERRQASNSYSVLMGQYPGSDVLSEDYLPVLEPLTTAISPYQLMDQRPDLKAAFLTLQAADYQVAAAIADRLPRISIDLVYSEGGTSLSTLGDQSLFRFAAGLFAPVFDWGRLKTLAQQRESEARELLAILEQGLLSAVREVEDTYSLEKALFKEQMLLRDEIAIVEEAVEKARLRYINGEETFLPVLVSLANLQALQQEEITVQRNMLINRVLLLRALGAKWSNNRG